MYGWAGTQTVPRDPASRAGTSEPPHWHGTVRQLNWRGTGYEDWRDVRALGRCRYRFLTGVLDQNFWPDGVYLAPGDEAMACVRTPAVVGCVVGIRLRHRAIWPCVRCRYDLQAIKRFGHNYIRLHQVAHSPFIISKALCFFELLL
eukprot:COSAG01_NODE_3979_length_5471_cov_3.013217_3_plen_146_part_00